MLKHIKYGVGLFSLSLCFMATSANADHPSCITPSKSMGLQAVAPCDVTFTVIPTFVCSVLPQTGVYTIMNNTPVAIGINYIRIQNNDANPASDITISSTTCGASLAAGASCNITVSINTVGVFNRVLQIGVDTRQVQLNSPIITGCTPSPTPPTPTPPAAAFTCALGTTSTFATLAGTTITNTGPTVLNGDLGLSPGTAVTGFPPGAVTGTQHITDGTAATAQGDLTTLYNCLAALTCPLANDIGTTNQAGKTLTSAGPGTQNVFCSGTTINNNGVLTLNGDAASVFVFQAGSALNWNSGATIVLTGGLTAANVFWQVTSSAVLGTSTTFQGTIAALTSITMDTSSTMLGRALTRNAAVTFDANIITIP